MKHFRKKVNPGKNINNLAEKFDLSFIENNETIKYFLNHTLGKDYEIMLKKFVVAACNKWLPDWLKDKLSKSLISNLGSFIKEEYRDVTYFTTYFAPKIAKSKHEKICF